MPSDIYFERTLIRLFLLKIDNTYGWQYMGVEGGEGGDDVAVQYADPGVRIHRLVLSWGGGA